MSRPLLALLAALSLTSLGAAGVPESTELRVTGMTYVASRQATREVVLHSERATFRPALNLAELENVRARVTEDEDGQSFTVTCERAELNVETNDFLAEGDVQGETGDGRRYSAPWVRYDHERGLLYTDARVRMIDDTGSFSGDGFRYHVRDKRFVLLGNVQVEQIQ